MAQRDKELNKLVYAPFLNVDYLPKDDLYIFEPEKPRHRFNIIGSGMIGHEHMKVTMLEGRAEIYGIYDTSENSIKNAVSMFREYYPKQTLVVYQTLEDACNDTAVDGLIICTPNHTHLDVVKIAIKSGKNILVEKPMVTNLEDACEMKKIAENYSAVFQIGLQYRYKAIYTEARHEVLERKAVGDVKMINIVEHRVPFLDKIDQWNKFSKYSGGTLVEKCCHYFDLFNLFAASKPKSVYAVGGQAVNFKTFDRQGEKSDILDNASVIVVYENGIHASLNLCMFSPMFYEEITICGDEGRLRAYENEDYLPVHRPITHLEILTADFRPSKVSTPCYPDVIQKSGHMGGTFFEHKKFVDNIEGYSTDTATVEEGFWAVVVGIAAEAAVNTGKIVCINDILKGNY